MPALQSRPTLTIEERAEKQRLLVRDTLALCSLLTIVIGLTFITYLLFHSFAAHRLRLEERWKARGEAALQNGRPLDAVESLRSALAYSPDDRTLQIELATALAAAGRTQEAVVYFNTLQEAQPGDGMINLQLARLAVRQANSPLAISHYEAALDGVWQGDGTVRRRQVRLELARYLIAQRQFDEARSQLLIAAGNAADNHGLQLTVGSLLEQAESQASALDIYRKAAGFKDTRTDGLVGAGRAAAALGRFLLSRNLLDQADSQPDFSRMPPDERAAVRELLNQDGAILALYPLTTLSPHVRAVRVARAARLAQARLAACSVPDAGAGPLAGGASAGHASPVPGALDGASAPNAAPATGGGASGRTSGAIRSALGAVQRARETLAGAPPDGPAPPGSLPAEPTGSAAATLAALGGRWQQLPADRALEGQMERDAALLTGTLHLVYETERATAQLCGSPSGDDALLLKIAAAPDEIEQP